MTLGIYGITGRMGRAIYSVAQEQELACTLAIDRDDSPAQGKQWDPADPGSPTVVTLNDADFSSTDVVIDFTAPGATLALLDTIKSTGKPLVIGTTGFSDIEKETIQSVAREIPVLMAPNMSPGINLLYKLVQMAARSLDRSYDVEVYEAHHRYKKDAPSGTALYLVDAVRDMEGMDTAPMIHGREGFTGERSDREIGMQVVRGGDIVGDHTVMFAGLGERIELTHRAVSRDVLARGAVKAALFLKGKEPGLYSMFDVLGL